MNEPLVSRQALEENSLFEDVSPDIIDWVCERVEPVHLSVNEYLIHEDQPGIGFFLLLKGRLAVLRKVRGANMVMGRHETGAFFGEIQLLTGANTPVALRAEETCELAKFCEDAFRDLLGRCRLVEKRIFKALVDRTQGVANFIRSQEKMISLGTLAAGLAHELNNPASSLTRTMELLHPKILELQDMNLTYGRVEFAKEHTEKWHELRDRGFSHILKGCSIESDTYEREELFADWLKGLSIEKPYDVAASLVAAGMDLAELATLDKEMEIEEGLSPHQGIRWLALSFEVLLMVRDGGEAAKRIRELVGTVKSYSHMDEAPQQEIDVHEGIESTLLMLKHEWKYGVEIVREYNNELPKIPAYGGELNQVWTNIIQNAIQAMEGKGTLTIKTGQHGGHLAVEIIDTGPGIPKELQSRIFEPFFTTKPMGEGTGLGLEIAYRIVTNRHNGYLRCESKPGQTCFEVGLPFQKSDEVMNAL